MSDHVKHEWPLAAFTLSVQLGCGLALAATACERATTDAAILRPLGLSVFPMVALGLAFSLLHLGRPREGWRALRNLRHSPLSLEVLLTTVLALLALAYSGCWYGNRTDLTLVVGVLTSFFGLAAVVSSAQIYMVPTRPLWNAGWLPASFIGTTFLLGGVASAALVGGTSQFEAFLVALNVTAVGSLLLLTSAGWMLAIALRVCKTQPKGRSLARPRLWFALHLLIAVGALALFTNIAPSVVFVLMLAALSLGRMLMYSLGEPASRFDA